VPCRLDPVTYDHKEYAIHADDKHPDLTPEQRLLRDIFSNEHDEPADDDQPVTVADLLDLYLSDDYPRSVARDVLNRTSDDVYHSVNRIKAAIVTVARLSPEERAEFDRRTT